jgi:hypothetical protein
VIKAIQASGLARLCVQSMRFLRGGRIL